MSREQPMPVELRLELEQCLTELLDGVEGPYPQQLLFQGPGSGCVNTDAKCPLFTDLRCPVFNDFSVADQAA